MAFKMVAKQYQIQALNLIKYGRYMSENVNVMGLFHSPLSSTPKVVTHVPDHAAADHFLRVRGTIEGGTRRGKKLVELLPFVGIVLGAVGMGIHTAYHQLVHSPAIKISKLNRSSLWELDRPDQLIHSGKEFVNRSLFRKFGHIQQRESYSSGSSSSHIKPIYTTNSYITATATTTDKLVNH
ncbi:hypothetical protein DCAR_0626580 [Daucus carota subsp. sativus]|uniref:Uncharacterized protein n=1 Tax=Daucus carota subsp. sativus TaxID=79200 RepID=A0AAF0XF69_DAUCS|nr:PREDICTED: uncharacterized protein LOC108226368 [Daucus carota subsp. sativus]WOH07151.1 hypothetical protein DCAR_0626580 [Daucus carota subsp. sativus]